MGIYNILIVMSGVSDRYGRDLFFKINPIEIDDKITTDPVVDDKQSKSHKKKNARELLHAISNPANLDLAKSSLEVGRDIEEISLENFEEVDDRISDTAKESSILNYDMKIEFATFPDSQKNTITFDEFAGQDSTKPALRLASGHSSSSALSSVDHLDLSDITLEDSIADKEGITEFANNRDVLQEMAKQKPIPNTSMGNANSLEKELQRVRKDLASLQVIIKKHGISVSADIQTHADAASEYQDPIEVLEEISTLEEDIGIEEADDNTETDDIGSTTTDDIESTTTDDIESTTTDDSEITKVDDIENTATDDSEITKIDDIESTATDDIESKTTDDSEITKVDDIESKTTDDSEITKVDDIENTATDDSEITKIDDIEGTTTDDIESTTTDDSNALEHEEYAIGSVDAEGVTGTSDNEQSPHFYGHTDELNKREEEEMRHIISSKDLEALDRNSAHADKEVHIVDDTDVMENDDILLHIDATDHVHSDGIDALLSNSDYTLEEIISEDMHESEKPESSVAIAGNSSISEGDTDEYITSDTADIDTGVSHTDEFAENYAESVKIPDTEEKIDSANETEAVDSADDIQEKRQPTSIILEHINDTRDNTNAPPTDDADITPVAKSTDMSKTGDAVPLDEEADVFALDDDTDDSAALDDDTDDSAALDEEADVFALDDDTDDSAALDEEADVFALDDETDAGALDDDTDDSAALDEEADVFALDDETDDIAALDDDTDDSAALDEEADVFALDDETDDIAALDEEADVFALDDETDAGALDDDTDDSAALDEEADVFALDDETDTGALDDDTDDSAALDEEADVFALDDETDDIAALDEEADVFALDDETDAGALDDDTDDSAALDEEADVFALDDETDDSAALDDDTDDSAALDDETDDIVALDDETDDIVALDDETDDIVALDDDTDDIVALDDEQTETNIHDVTKEKDAVVHTSAVSKPQQSTTIKLNRVDSDELRTIVKYMDNLLEQLPEDTVEEFAHSKYFDIYERLFEDLEMKDF